MKKRMLLFCLCIVTISFPCHCQGQKNNTKNSNFKQFVSSFETILPSINFKKFVSNKKHKDFLMSSKDAIRYLDMKMKDLYYWEGDEAMDPPHTVTQEKVDCTPTGVFKYSLNDSILILCTYQYKGEQDTTFVHLNTFNLKGKLLQKCFVGGNRNNPSEVISFVVLDRAHFKVFYFEENEEKVKRKAATYYYTIDYEITQQGHFIQKTKTSKNSLKDEVNYYYNYRANSDDPMNKY